MVFKGQKLFQNLMIGCLGCLWGEKAPELKLETEGHGRQTVIRFTAATHGCFTAAAPKPLAVRFRNEF